MSQHKVPRYAVARSFVESVFGANAYGDFNQRYEDTEEEGSPYDYDTIPLGAGSVYVVYDTLKQQIRLSGKKPKFVFNLEEIGGGGQQSE